MILHSVCSGIAFRYSGMAIPFFRKLQTEMQNNFGRYLNLVMSGYEVIVTKNGKEIGRFIPKEATVSYLTDSLIGILKGDYDLDKEKTERLIEKNGPID